MRDGRSRRRPGLDAQREAITTAAVRLFAEAGTEQVGVSRICAEAAVSRPTFYRCFDDKDALVAHLYALAVDDHVQLELDAVLEARDAAGVRAALFTMMDRIFARPDLAAFVFVESAHEGSIAARIVRDAFARSAARIEEAYAARAMRAPPRKTLEATMAACQWLVHDAIRRGLGPAVRQEARDATWALVRAVFAVPLR